MATATLLAAMSAERDKSVHPFFTRAQAHTDKTASDDDAIEQLPRYTADEEYEMSKRKTSRRTKEKDDQQPKGKLQRTLGEIVNPKAPEPVQENAMNLCTPEPGPDLGRRKRRRTGEYASVHVGSEEDAKMEDLDGSKFHVYQQASSPQVISSVSSPRPQTKCAEDGGTVDNSKVFAQNTPPKKVLRLNANGKFISPPSKNSKDQTASEAKPEQPRRRGRPRGPAKPAIKSCLLVKFNYGFKDSKRQHVGETINRILNGEEIFHISAQTTPGKKAKTSLMKKRTVQKPAKPFHPFFGGRPKGQPTGIQIKESPRKASAVTPGKLRMQTFSDQVHESRDVPFTSALLKDRLVTKYPGARDPPFPAKGQVHVRGLQPYEVLKTNSIALTDATISQRKCKRANVPLSRNESVLSRFAAQLTPEDEAPLRADGFHEPDSSLHVPDRLLLSGEEIARMVANELSVDVLSSNDEELSYTNDKPPHPALRDLLHRIPAFMTAYDDSKGESFAWTQKHAPTSSKVVLQPESEMNVLRDWLKSLAVQAVVGAASAPDKCVASRGLEKPRKKRQKTADDLDDFLVDSDEEPHEMSELPEDGSACSIKTAQKSVIQIPHDRSKLSNVVLLSGPNGCGKTAAAYAVAKELEFKVFEISSSERRSGRDVLDRVGDMTENHLVKHHGTGDLTDLSSSEDNGRIDDAFKMDLDSGKQEKLNAFFKPQSKLEPSQPKKIVKEKKVKAIQEALKKPAKDQKQSLILLEEVDVLFKEDKEFWSTILKLITTSKRPFIMTCNDEDLVPLQAISLHAILRFSRPPAELATDYMLLMAAAEGHLLRREAVASLYNHQAQDLRSSIAKLDYWCQMGVGDPRGGLTWIYQRWPPGSDVDQKGRTLRVISKGTLQNDTGISSASTNVEDTLSWLLHEVGVAPSTALGWDSMLETIDFTYELETLQESLQRYTDFADSLSAADLCCAKCLPGIAHLDPSQPDLSEKARGNYVEGAALLQTDGVIDYSALSEHLFLSQLVMAGQVNRECGLQGEPSLSTVTPRQKLDESLSRHAFSCFDAISTPAGVSVSHPGFQQSAFDGTMRTIALDLAPYVRFVVQYDQALEEQRKRLDLVTSGGDGRKAKRARTTRAARSALKGGQRACTRRERWFTEALDMDAVLATGGKDWPRLGNTLASLDGVGNASPDSSSEYVEITYE